MAAKVISTIIEDEVIFLKEADVEFVSLVKHGANRTPFKILKSEKDEGGNVMSKVVIAVLIPKSLSEDEVKEQLNEYRDDEVKEFDTYKSYIQVSDEAIDLNTREVVLFNGDKQVFGVVASLKAEGKGEEGEKTAKKKETGGKAEGEKGKVAPKVVEKEALDYATMDSLYEELYAMADICSGAMRQTNIEPAARRKTILAAIDNFRSFAEMLLKSLKDEEVKAVKAEDHPKLLPFHSEKQNEHDCKCTACGAELTTEKACYTTDCPECGASMEIKEGKVEKVEDGPKFDSEAFRTDLMKDVGKLISEAVEAFSVETAGKLGEVTALIGNVDKKVAPLVESLDLLKEIPESLKSLTKEVDTIRSTTKTTKKSDVDDDLVSGKKGKGTFGGVLFTLPAAAAKE